jgi:hypothetical protein
MILPAPGGPAFPEQRVCWWKAITMFSLLLSATLQRHLFPFNLVLVQLLFQLA